MSGKNKWPYCSIGVTRKPGLIDDSVGGRGASMKCNGTDALRVRVAQHGGTRTLGNPYLHYRCEENEGTDAC